jgi:NAD(P)-dependent dehydrogenase (short-subunit alcohol dehydrogenase family)
MNGSLKNKTMIVTGASSGIGAAVARRFAADGVKLALVARSAERLKALADDIGSECIALPLDLTTPADVATMVKETTDRFGPVDILFANAGSYVAGEVASGDPEGVSRGSRGAPRHDRSSIGRHRRHIIDLRPSGDPLGADLFGDQARGAVVRSWRAAANRQAQCADRIVGAGNGLK